MNVAIHGTWVRSTRTDEFGRIAYMVYDRAHEGSVEAMVMWQPSGSGKTGGGFTASYHFAEELNVRPYKPRPWFQEERIVDSVRYTDTYAGT